MPNVSPVFEFFPLLDMTGSLWQTLGAKCDASKLERQERARWKINRPDCKRSFRYNLRRQFSSPKSTISPLYASPSATRHIVFCKRAIVNAAVYIHCSSKQNQMTPPGAFLNINIGFFPCLSSCLNSIRGFSSSLRHLSLPS